MNRDTSVIDRIPLMLHYSMFEWTSFRFYLLISFTRLTLDIYLVYIISSCKTLPTWTLSPFFIIPSSLPDLRVDWLLEVFSSTPLHLVLPFKLNAVDYIGSPVIDFLRYDGTVQCILALRCEYAVHAVHL